MRLAFTLVALITTTLSEIAAKTPSKLQCQKLARAAVKQKRVFTCPQFNQVTSLVQREKGGNGRVLKVKCEAAGCCWYPFRDKKKRCYTSKDNYLQQKRQIQKLRGNGGRRNDKKPRQPKPDAVIPTTKKPVTTTIKPKRPECVHDPLIQPLICKGGQKSQEICESKGCCWNQKPLKGMRHRCVQAHDWAVTHFGGAMDKNSHAQKKKANQAKCVKEHQTLDKIELDCPQKIPELTDRVKCDLTTLQSADASLSQCDACAMAGCCFDHKPKVRNGKLVPMCFNTTTAYLNSLNEKKKEVVAEEPDAETNQRIKEELDKLSDNVDTLNSLNQVMTGGGHPTAAPGTSSGNRYSGLIKNMYGREDLTLASATEDTAKKAFSENPKVNALLALMGGSGKGNSLPPMGFTGASNTGNKKVDSLVNLNQQPWMSGNDKVQSLMTMLSGGKTSENAQSIDKIRAAMGVIQSDGNSLMNTGISISQTDGEHSGPRFKKPIYGQMYRKQLNTMKLQLSQSSQPQVYRDQQWAFYKRAIDKVYAKYMVYDGKAERQKVVPTFIPPPADKSTPAPAVEPVAIISPGAGVSTNTGSIHDDSSTGSVDSSVNERPTGDVRDYGVTVNTGEIPYIQETYQIGNDEPGSCYPSICGNPVRDNYNSGHIKKMVGGTWAGGVEYWPWQVSLRRFYENDKVYSHFCGATLISETWILSAAHCFKKYLLKLNPLHVMEDQPNTYLAHIGRYAKEDYEESVQVRRIASYIHHERFNPAGSPTEFDIAVAKMALPVRITTTVRPICLPAMDAPAHAGEKIWVTGWGETKGNIGGNNEYLKELPLPVAGIEQCRSDWPDSYNSGWLCADTGLNEDACTGDSGGPAVQKTRDGRWRLVGVVSAGSADCSTSKVKSAVFSNVVHFRQWIDRATQDMCRRS